MDKCEQCKFNKDGEGEVYGDMWLKRKRGGFYIEAPIGESEVFYCPWCGLDLSEVA